MSFLRRLFGSNDSALEHNLQSPSCDIQPVGAFLKHKFSRGIDYNVKIVIRGDRGVGKTTLLKRLKGEPFIEQYITSAEIQVATVHWNHGDTNDVVKVEVWDVVDKAIPRPRLSNALKLSNDGDCQDLSEPSLDATFINVYKGAHGLILMIDMTKASTFDYARKELSRVPNSLPVLLLANRRDMEDCREVTEQQVRDYLRTEFKRHTNCSKGSPPSIIQYCEASMLNGFGLLYIHKFFNLPFLYLQNAILRRGLTRNEFEFNRTLSELESKEGPISTSQAAYERFMQIRRSSRNNQQPMESRKANARAPPPSSTAPTIINDFQTDKQLANPNRGQDQQRFNNVSFESNPQVLSFEEDVDPADVILPSAIPLDQSHAMLSSSDGESSSPETSARLNNRYHQVEQSMNKQILEDASDSKQILSFSPTLEVCTSVVPDLKQDQYSDVELEVPHCSAAEDDSHLHKLLAYVVASTGEDALEQFLADV